jgi:hypothetical protein
MRKPRAPDHQTSDVSNQLKRQINIKTIYYDK